MSYVRRPVLTASALGVALLPVVVVQGLATGPATADDVTCVGRSEYRHIKGGMPMQKLTALLDGQVSLADLPTGNGRIRVRWYAACDGWQPVKDVAVRYHKPVVGRRTVAGKKLAVYQAEPPPTEGPRESPSDGPSSGPTSGPTGKPGPRHPR